MSGRATRQRADGAGEAVAGAGRAPRNAASVARVGEWGVVVEHQEEWGAGS